MTELTWAGKIVMGVTVAAFYLVAFPFWVAGWIAYRLGLSGE